MTTSWLTMSVEDLAFVGGRAGLLALRLHPIVEPSPPVIEPFHQGVRVGWTFVDRRQPHHRLEGTSEWGFPPDVAREGGEPEARVCPEDDRGPRITAQCREGPARPRRQHMLHLVGSRRLGAVTGPAQLAD